MDLECDAEYFETGKDLGRHLFLKQEFGARKLIFAGSSICGMPRDRNDDWKFD